MDETIRDFQNHFPRFRTMLEEAQKVILDNAVSDYPVFVFSRTESDLGISLYESADPERDWFVYASTLEELAAKNIVDSSRIENFKSIYKDTFSHFCILLLDGSSARFAFPPKKGIPFSDN